MSVRSRVFLPLLLSLFSAVPASAQERPYFVTYDPCLEEPGHLEIAGRVSYEHHDDLPPDRAEVSAVDDVAVIRCRHLLYAPEGGLDFTPPVSVRT